MFRSDFYKNHKFIGPTNAARPEFKNGAGPHVFKEFMNSLGEIPFIEFCGSGVRIGAAFLF